MVVSATHFKDVTNGYERRTDGLWLHTGKLIVQGGPVELPPGSIGTAELAPGAAQATVAEMSTGLTFATSANNVWQETPLQLSTSFSSVRVRVEYSVAVVNSLAAGHSNVGLGIDGAVFVHVGAAHHAVAGGIVTFSGVWYCVPGPGVHRIAVFFNAGSGQMSIYGITSTLYLTEQRA